MILFLGSELMFFAALFASYFTLRSQSPAWPPRGTILDLPEATAFTAILIASSGAMERGLRRVARGDVPRMRRWIRIALVLGVVFLAGQAYGYLRANFHIGTGAFGSTFYALTGFHALHVLGGLLVMLVVLRRSAAGAYSSDRHEGVAAAAYYWHFVDVVWLALFATIYLVT